MLLTDNGCQLPSKYRPKMGRDLVPASNSNNCIPKYSKQQVAIDWLPYYDVLSQLVDSSPDPIDLILGLLEV